MMRGASGDEWGNLLGQEYNRPAEAGVLKKPQEATLTFFFNLCVLCKRYKTHTHTQSQSQFFSSCIHFMYSSCFGAVIFLAFNTK
jgi:hypothetical protein